MGSKDSQGEAIVHLLFILVVGAAIGFVIFDGATKVDAVYLALYVGGTRRKILKIDPSIEYIDALSCSFFWAPLFE